MGMTSAPRTARAIARRELTTAIVERARQQLADVGPAQLSVRQIARDLGMASSAVYRYFPSRDELLTALIIDAYDSVADAAEAAETAIPRTDVAGRWMATCRAVRTWAVANPHEYALIFGSPIPGYAAPQDTIDPASRVALALLQIVVDGVAAGEIDAGDDPSMPRVVRADFAELRAMAAPGVPDAVISRTLLAWSALFGSVSLEMFGHLHNVIHDYDAYFTIQMRRTAEFLVKGN